MDLKGFFTAHPKAALAFSGGVDSAYLLWAARECGADIRPYCVASAFQPGFERREAEEFCALLGAELTVLPVDILAVKAVTENPADRCYHCKTAILSAIRERALADGYETLLDGTNASDDAGDRPGMRALREFGVLSPLRLCGLTKAAIRERSREAGLPTWDKPAYACLATRIPTGTAITRELLERVEGAEGALRDLGFRDFRVRWFHDAARVQLPKAQLASAARQAEELREALSPWFSAVLLDLEGR